MNAIFKWIENNLMPAMTKIGNQRHMVAIRDGVVSVIPLVIVGSFFLIIAYPPITSWAEAVKPYVDYILLPQKMTMGLMALYAAFTIGYSLSRAYQLNPMSGGLLSVMAFLLTAAPMDTAKLATQKTLSFIPVDFLGGKGLFTAIVVAIISVEIFRFLKQKGITIKMPEGVPPAIVAAFESLIPVAIIIGLLYPISLIVKTVTGLSIPAAIMNLFAPLVSTSDTVFAVVIAALVAQLLWSVGIHGASIVSAIMEPFYLTRLEANVAALQAGLPLPYIFVKPFWAFYIVIGGSGATLGLIFLYLMARSAHLKQVGKLAILPGIFNINEPIIFGTPMVMNPILFIPFVFAQVVNGVLAYLAVSSGLVSKITVLPPWTTPAPIGAFIATRGDWRAPLLVIVLAIISTIIYYPFVKIYDKQMYEKEKERREE